MPLTPPRALALALPLLLASYGSLAQAPATPPTPGCDVCTAWNADQAPFRIFGNTYYVGVKGLSSVLITSPQGPGRVKTQNQARAAELYTPRRVMWRVESIRELCRVFGGGRPNQRDDGINHALDGQ